MSSTHQGEPLPKYTSERRIYFLSRGINPLHRNKKVTRVHFDRDLPCQNTIGLELNPVCKGNLSTVFTLESESKSESNSVASIVINGFKRNKNGQNLLEETVKVDSSGSINILKLFENKTVKGNHGTLTYNIEISNSMKLVEDVIENILVVYGNKAQHVLQKCECEDEKTLNECVTKAVNILGTFSGDVSGKSFSGANSLSAHAESQCKRMLLVSDKEKVKRSRFLLTLAELKSDFEFSSSPKTIVSDDDVASADVLSDSEEKFIHPEPKVSVSEVEFKTKQNHLCILIAGGFNFVSKKEVYNEFQKDTNDVEGPPLQKIQFWSTFQWTEIRPPDFAHTSKALMLPTYFFESKVQD
ncbi:hypothetical protein FQA39_LY03606 [Lamprigera yunnana]|nr:hypothetical protein FQA39_LY03606 [Lamprigera yunnana]